MKNKTAGSDLQGTVAQAVSSVSITDTIAATRVKAMDSSRSHQRDSHVNFTSQQKAMHGRAAEWSENGIATTSPFTYEWVWLSSISVKFCRRPKILSFNFNLAVWYVGTGNGEDYSLDEWDTVGCLKTSLPV